MILGAGGHQTAAIVVNVPISVVRFAVSGMGRWVDFMTREQECIVELYTLLERIEDGARHHDLSLLRVPRGATGCDMYQGLPPICRVKNDILDRYEDVICTVLDMKG